MHVFAADPGVLFGEGVEEGVDLFGERLGEGDLLGRLADLLILGALALHLCDECAAGLVGLGVEDGEGVVLERFDEA